MAGDRKVKLLILDEWELEEQEAWLNDMAKQGWFLEKLTFGFAIFQRGEPKDTRYRLEIATKNKRLEEEQIELYEASGWEYVTSRRFIHVFQEQTPGETVEIHTDPIIHAEALKRLKQNIFNRGIAVILLTLIMLFIQFSIFANPSSSDFLANHILFNIYMITVYLFFAVSMLQGMVHISRLIKKLKDNKSFNHEKPYKTNWMIRKTFYYLFTFISIFFFIMIWADGNTFALEHDYPKIPDTSLPVITLSEVENVSLKEVSYASHGVQRQRENHFREQSSLLVPQQYMLEQRFIILDDNKSGYEPSLSSHRYEARGEWLASKLVDALKRERAMDDHTNIQLDEFDEAWLLERNGYISFIARKGHTIFAIRYTGNESSERLLELMKGFTF